MRLAELRKKAGLSQRNLAIILNCSQNMVSQWENGTRDPSTDTLKALADYFHVSTDYLLGRNFPSADTPPENENIEQKEDIKEICALFEKLPDNKKALVLQMARIMLEDKI